MSEPAQMTAAVLYGREDLKVERVPVPEIADDEVLVRVRVALTCGTDLKVWRQGSHARMIRPPALFGHELAGEIVRKGRNVHSAVREGMRVVPANSAPCGECFYCRKDQPNLCEDLLFNNGAYAEFIRVPGRIVRRNMLEIPESVAFADAAMAEPLACVLRGVHEIGVRAGDTVAVIGCGAIGLQFVRVLAARGIRVIALGKRPSQLGKARQLGAEVALDASALPDAPSAVREHTEARRGADAVVEAVGSGATWEWAVRMARKGGVVNFFGGCPPETEVKFDAAALHYSELTLKASFHHTPRFMREALDAVLRGEIRAADFVTGEAKLADLPRIFEQMKNRNGQMKFAVIP